MQVVFRNLQYLGTNNMNRFHRWHDVSVQSVISMFMCALCVAGNVVCDNTAVSGRCDDNVGDGDAYLYVMVTPATRSIIIMLKCWQCLCGS